jgi:hypothetical protein
MKQKIHGNFYDTDTATLLASEQPWAVASGEVPGIRKKFLYRTPEGRFFIWHRTQWEKARDILEPLTSDAAKESFHQLPVKVQEFGDAFSVSGR